MNAISLLYLITAIFSLVFGVYVYSRDKHNSKNVLFLWFAVNGFYWGFTGFGLRQADSFEMAYLWQKVGAFWPFAVASIFHFSIVYTELMSKIKKTILFIIIYLPALVFSFIELGTDQITIVKNTSWGWTTDLPTLSIPYITSTIWSIIVAFAAIILTINYFFREKDAKKRKKTALITVALFIPISLSTLSEVLIPLVNTTMPKLTVPGYVLSLAIIGFAMWKYELFSLNPYTAADKIVDTMPDMLLLSSLDGKIKMVNQSTADELNYRNTQSFINKKIIDFTRLDEQRILGHNRYKSFETTFQRKNGDEIPVLLSKSMIVDNKKNPVGFVFIGKNIIDLKETEAKLKRLNQTLDKKVKHRTQEIEKLLDEKDDFIHILSHDIKNPLGPLLNLLPVAKNRSKDEKVKKILDICLKNSEKIKTLITETVRLSLVDEKDSQSLERVNLNEIIHSTIQDYKSLFDENNIEIEDNFENEIIVTGNRFQLSEVISNLLTNAVKYTPENKEGFLSVNAVMNDGMVTVSFSDNGQGMTKDQINKIFEKFYYQGTPRKGMDSSGLGLAICKSIVEKHGGHIWAESPGHGKGSTFYFTLPLQKKVKTIDKEEKNYSQIYDEVKDEVDRIIA